MVQVNFGYGWVCPIAWLMANFNWWGAMVAGHIGEPGIALMAVIFTYYCICDMHVPPPRRPAYERFARWEYREQESTTAWCARSTSDSKCTTPISCGCHQSERAGG